MVILGIDPGTTSIGYALIEGMRGKNPRLLDAGLISIFASSRPQRLKELHIHIKTLLNSWKPDVAATERLFFAKNTKTAMEVSEARGVILLTVTLAEVNVYEYTPLETKLAITGDGRADKSQVKKMVHLTMPETANLKAKDDVFDAIAVALTCFFKERNNKVV